jgi:2-dehydro-3-deoxygluconokinase
MSKILTVGEPMALFVAEREGSLEEVESFLRPYPRNTRN